MPYNSWTPQLVSFPGSQAGVATAASQSGAILLQEDFEDPDLTQNEWYDCPTSGITTTSNPHSGTRCMQSAWAQGANGPTWVGARHLFTATPTLYLRVWVKYSTNFVGSGQPYHPHEFYFFTNIDDDAPYQSPGYNRLTPYVESHWSVGGDGTMRFEQQDAQNIVTSPTPPNSVAGAVAGCNVNPDGYGSPQCFEDSPGVYVNGKAYPAASASLTAAAGAGYKNDWHKVEAYFAMNSVSAGVAAHDGAGWLKFDGALIINRTGMQWRTGAHASQLFDQILIAPYIGDGSPVAQTSWYDDLVVATAPVP